jgi:predicted metal-dependent peptidase
MNVLPRESTRADLPTCRATREEQRFVDDGLSYLNMTTPFWSGVLYHSMYIVFTDAVPWAATDAHVIFVNAAAMIAEGWGIEECAFVLAHEVMHYLYCDLLLAMGWREANSIICPDGTVLPYDHHHMNRAMDYRINAALVDAKVGRMPKIGLYDPSISAKGMESCVDIYAKTWRERKDGGKGFDEHLEPSPAQQEEEKKNGDLRRAGAIAAGVQAATAAGSGALPAAVRQLIGEILEPKTRWQDHLRSSMQRAAGEPAHDWGKLDKRHIARPEPWGKIVFARRADYGCGTVVVGYDTSGSCIKPEVQQKFFSEMAAIVADLNPTELIVLWCDTHVQRVDRIEEPSDLEQLRLEINAAGGAPGGGGTKFTPVFDWIRDEHVEPDMVVYLTDCLGSFPKSEPDYHTIWASIRPNSKVPFGTLVEID